jgi:hypothetical protein
MEEHPHFYMEDGKTRHLFPVSDVSSKQSLMRVLVV